MRKVSEGAFLCGYLLASKSDAEWLGSVEVLLFTDAWVTGYFPSLNRAPPFCRGRLLWQGIYGANSLLHEWLELVRI